MSTPTPGETFVAVRSGYRFEVLPPGPMFRARSLDAAGALVFELVPSLAAAYFEQGAWRRL